MVSRHRAGLVAKVLPIPLDGCLAVAALMGCISPSTSPSDSLNRPLFAMVIVAIAAYLSITLRSLDAPSARMTVVPERTPELWSSSCQVALCRHGRCQYCHRCCGRLSTCRPPGPWGRRSVSLVNRSGGLAATAHLEKTLTW